MNNTFANTIEHYLQRPYARILIPEEDGTFAAEVLELPGCYAFGETADEVMTNLENSMANWFEAALSKNQTVPDPVSENEPSGKVLLRLPRNLHKRAIQMAEHDRVSLNTFLVEAVTAKVQSSDLAKRVLMSIETLFSQPRVQNIQQNYYQLDDPNKMMKASTPGSISQGFFPLMISEGTR